MAKKNPDLLKAVVRATTPDEAVNALVALGLPRNGFAVAQILKVLHHCQFSALRAGEGFRVRRQEAVKDPTLAPATAGPADVGLPLDVIVLVTSFVRSPLHSA